MHLYKGLVLKYCLITRDARVGSSPGRVVGNSSPIGLRKGSGDCFLLLSDVAVRPGVFCGQPEFGRGLFCASKRENRCEMLSNRSRGY